MKNFYKYLPVSNKDLKFGLAVRNCGYANTPPHKVYPDPEHPSHHYFNFENGRILQEYQILYIVEGGGVFESESAGKISIKEGSILFLFPGEWHRYRPNEKTGWSEYWIGFSGVFVEHLSEKNFLNPASPIINIGHNEEIVNLYLQIFKILKEENIGFHNLVSGLALHLLGLLFAQKARQSIKSDHVEKIIAKSKLIFLESLNTQITPEDVAKQLNISYSWFRKLFKTYTSFSPKEYLIEHRISRAKQSLLTTSKSIKEIAGENGFNSQYHFTKIFKKKTKQTPTEFRSKTVITY